MNLEDLYILRRNVETPSWDQLIARPFLYLDLERIPAEVKHIIPDNYIPMHPQVESFHDKSEYPGCHMAIDKLDYRNYFQMMHGFLYGLTLLPPTEVMQCHICMVFGEAFGQMQEGIVGLEAARLLWVNPRDILNLKFWDRVNRLLFVYLMCLTVFTNLDRIFRHPQTRILYNQIPELFTTEN